MNFSVVLSLLEHGGATQRGQTGVPTRSAYDSFCEELASRRQQVTISWYFGFQATVELNEKRDVVGHQVSISVPYVPHGETRLLDAT